MANYYVTVSGASGKTGANWANAFGLSEWVAHMAASAATGDRYWIAGGTYTLTAGLTAATVGTSANCVSCIGVASGTTNEPPVASDFAEGADRPLVAAGAYAIALPGWWLLRGIRETMSTTSGISIGGGGLVNCDISSTASSGYLVTASSMVQIHDTKLNGNEEGCNGLSLAATSVVSHCMITEMTDYDINMGSGASLILINSIANSYELDKIKFGSGMNFILGNTLHSCDPCIVGGAYGNNIILNNNFNDGPEGINFSSNVNQLCVDHNNYYAIAEAYQAINVSKGANALSVDPGFVDADEYNDADFSFTSASPVVAQGFKMRLGVGA